MKRSLFPENHLGERTSNVKTVTYALYAWNGKCRWAYLHGMYLVDPLYVEEFKESMTASGEDPPELEPLR